MPKKPPSQRAERKLDETARAIARVREEAKPEKPPVEFQSENRAKSGSLPQGAIVKKAAQASSPPKRQKKG